MKYETLKVKRTRKRREFGSGTYLAVESTSSLNKRKTRSFVDELQEVVDLLKENDNERAYEILFHTQENKYAIDGYERCKYLTQFHSLVRFINELRD